MTLFASFAVSWALFISCAFSSVRGNNVLMFFTFSTLLIESSCLFKKSVTLIVLRASAMWLPLNGKVFSNTAWKKTAAFWSPLQATSLLHRDHHLLLLLRRVWTCHLSSPQSKKYNIEKTVTIPIARALILENCSKSVRISFPWRLVLRNAFAFSYPSMRIWFFTSSSVA